MRLTHYEDGLLCGERFCINLIRHCGDTFPDLGEGQGLNRFLTYIHIVFLTPFPAFSFETKGPKEKANKKKRAVKGVSLLRERPRLRLWKPQTFEKV